MHFLIALIIWSFLVLASAFVGHIVAKIFKSDEENSLLKLLIEIATGFSFLLIIINLIGRVTGNLYLALLIALLIIISTCILRRIELTEFLKSFFEKLKNLENKYLIILLLSINLIYGLTAFSTIKIDHLGFGDKHIFSINQLIAGTYPPKYFFN